MTDTPKGAVQSTQPEDTRLAREENLIAEDFDEPVEELPELTFEMIRDAHDDAIEKVPCPEWGGFAYVRNPSATERNAFERESAARRDRRGASRDENLRDLKERLVMRFMCHKDRSAFFDCSTPHKIHEAIVMLRAKGAAPVNRIGDCVLRLGGWTEDDVEDLVGNSKSAPS